MIPHPHQLYYAWSGLYEQEVVSKWLSLKDEERKKWVRLYDYLVKESK